jgi:hypothetical protein
MGDWSTHGESTGGHYRCNVFDKKKTESMLAQLREEQSKVLGAGERKDFFSERFKNHINAAQFALQLKDFFAKSKKGGQESMEQELQLLEAYALQLHKAHSRLAWSYCFRYFCGEGIHMDVFEAVQGVVEFHTEMFHESLDSAKNSLKRIGKAVTKDELLNAFITHRIKVDAIANETHRSVKELQGTVQELIEANVLPSLPSDSLSVVEGKTEKVNSTSDKVPVEDWECVLCEKLNVGASISCEDCFNPRLIGTDIGNRIAMMEKEKRATAELSLQEMRRKKGVEGIPLSHKSSKFYGQSKRRSTGPATKSQKVLEYYKNSAPVHKYNCLGDAVKLGSGQGRSRAGDTNIPPSQVYYC